MPGMSEPVEQVVELVEAQAVVQLQVQSLQPVVPHKQHWQLESVRLLVLVLPVEQLPGLPPVGLLVVALPQLQLVVVLPCHVSLDPGVLVMRFVVPVVLVPLAEQLVVDVVPSEPVGPVLELELVQPVDVPPHHVQLVVVPGLN